MTNLMTSLFRGRIKVMSTIALDRWGGKSKQSLYDE